MITPAVLLHGSLPVDLLSVKDKEKHKGTWRKEMKYTVGYIISLEGKPLPGDGGRERLVVV